MLSLLLVSQITFFIQLAHSIEELSTGFHKQWYLFKMPFYIFLLFEIVFTLFWFISIFTSFFQQNEIILRFFLLLMFANGIQHLVWFGSVKRYVPGLGTALLHIGWLTYFYLSQ